MVKSANVKNNEVHQNTLKKHNELAEVLRLLSIPLTKKQIRDKLKISKTSLANYLSKLELSGNILRKGKYEVQVLSSSLIHLKVTKTKIDRKLNKRGHAHNFKVIFPQEKEDLRIKPLIKEQLSNNKITSLKFGSLRLDYKKFTIWINKSTLTVYSNNSYYSDNALTSKFTALKELDLLIKYLKNRFNIKGIYGIEIFREHYGLIFNEFASWLLEKGEKMEIKDKGNRSILWVDDSKEDDVGLKELESSNALQINHADELFKSHIRTGWNETPEKNIKEHEQLKNDLKQLDSNLKESLDRLKKTSENQINTDLVIEQISNNLNNLTKQVSVIVEILNNK